MARGGRGSPDFAQPMGETMIIIAERINSSRKSIAQAIEAQDREFIQKEARNQAEAGATYIDVNAGSFVGLEIGYLKWLVEVVQEVVDLPLCLDSPDPQAIKEALPLCRQKPLINSITLEQDRLEGLLPLVVEHGLPVIALCQSEAMTADTREDKVELASQLVAKADAAGLPRENLFIDPLVYPVSTDSNSALASIQAIGDIMTRFPGVHTTCGLTNVSYGMPQRKLINRAFLAAALVHGLDSAIIDPTDIQLYSLLKATLLVLGRDDFGMEYIGAFRAGRLTA